MKVIENKKQKQSSILPSLMTLPRLELVEEGEI